MKNQLTLDDIALGDIAIADARTIVFDALTTLDRHGAQRVYAAFRDWLWKTINGRRRDDELNDWYELMRRAAARLSKEHFAQSERITALYELLYETVSASEVLRADVIVRRKHVQQLIDLLAVAQNYSLERAHLQSLMHLNQANLSRIISMMEAAGLLERTVFGKHVNVALTRLGLSFSKTSPTFDADPHAVSTDRILSVVEAVLLRKMTHHRVGHSVNPLQEACAPRGFGKQTVRAPVGELDFLAFYKEDFHDGSVPFHHQHLLRAHE